MKELYRASPICFTIILAVVLLIALGTILDMSDSIKPVSAATTEDWLAVEDSTDVTYRPLIPVTALPEVPDENGYAAITFVENIPLHIILENEQGQRVGGFVLTLTALPEE